MIALLNRLNLHESVLIAVADSNLAVEKSASNLGDVKILRVQYLNVQDLLGYEHLLLPRRSLEVIQETWGTP